jgi:hypothetical protein
MKKQAENNTQGTANIADDRVLASVNISWHEIIKHAESFAENRGINPIDAVRCFEECAKFIKTYPLRKGKFN